MKGPPPCSSTASYQGDARKNRSRLARGAWQLLLLLLCGPGLVKFYAPLLGLQAARANVASHCLSVCMLGLCILWCSSLQVGGGLTLILARKLCVEVLLPVQQALWQPLTIARSRGLQLLSTLVHRARRCVPRLLRHVRWEASLALLSVAPWAYSSLVDFHHENSKALELLLRAVLQQVAVSLLVRCLDELWVAVGQVARAMRGSGLQPLEWARLCQAAPKDLDAVTAVLPAPTVPFSQRFPGPDPATLSRLTPASISLCLVVGDKDASKDERGCGFGATEVPISTRFQGNRTSKMAFRSSSKQALAQQVKATCALIILLYIYAASLFVQILK
ncbi:hypothetical protein HPG69_017650 [Diceros bicornis minor]|uniref:Uncharacterized protein n=1 Tax=Diceros bicornis minor TaxID=77932 RepID=A0A7J7FJ83_DICBM|nr:hypothetical protein HPG69_017650 [Diceros bicornis minor]